MAFSMAWGDGKLVRNARRSGYHVYYYYSSLRLPFSGFAVLFIARKATVFMVLWLGRKGRNGFFSRSCLDSN